MEFLKALWARIKEVMHFIGRVQTAILITLFYWFIVGPTSLVLCLFRVRLLERHPDSRLTSYWIDKQVSGSLEERLRKQF